jgi:hypothetical protein
MGAAPLFYLIFAAVSHKLLRPYPIYALALQLLVLSFFHGAAAMDADPPLSLPAPSLLALAAAASAAAAAASAARSSSAFTTRSSLTTTDDSDEGDADGASDDAKEEEEEEDVEAGDDHRLASAQAAAMAKLLLAMPSTALGMAGALDGLPDDVIRMLYPLTDGTATRASTGMDDLFSAGESRKMNGQRVLGRVSPPRGHRYCYWGTATRHRGL